MLKLDVSTREALIETLYDLKHDLGKYLKLPVAMLPKDASAEELAAQVVRAVEETRKGPGGTVSAAQLFERFSKEWAPLLETLDAYRALGVTLERALSWAPRAKANSADLPREAVVTDLCAVADAIGVLLMEVEGGQEND